MNGISVNIDRLVLSGVSDSLPHHGQQIGRMTETALRSLFAERGVPRELADKDLREIAAPPINLPLGASDRQIARELANHLYRLLSRLPQR